MVMTSMRHIEGGIGGIAMNQSINRSVFVPIFPLPIVLFPSIELPLHIFDIRYREMVHNVLQAGRTSQVRGRFRSRPVHRSPLG